MQLTPSQLAAALDNVSEALSQASAYLEEFSYTGDDHLDAAGGWQINLAYTQLLVITESLGLPTLLSEIRATYAEARKAGITKVDKDEDDNRIAQWLSPARRYHRSLQNTYGIDSARTVTRDIVAILRSAGYAITDPAIFGSAPTDEAILHKRIEAILRCVFPDLVHKPRLGKPIKNFEPDTGIPSIQTLVEYKFLSAQPQVAKIADEILADTRGYTSREWKSFIYVIYETNRFRPEIEWHQLLRASGVPPNATVVVLSGTSTKRGAPRTIPATDIA